MPSSEHLDISRFVPPSRLSLLRQVAALSADLGFPAYLVGGFVRDALLEKPINDFDIVVEGDATKLGHALVKQFGGRVTVHAPFKTATWFIPVVARSPRHSAADDFIDLISARSETYEQPAALPTVMLGTLADDLRRRDFTINAMAVRLDGEHFGELTDPLGGRDDLERGVLRVLHPNSFIDDPTRLFRLVRYAGRYEFKIDSKSEALIPAALPFVDKLSPERLRHELDLIFEEENAVPMLEKLWALGIVQSVRPALPSDEATRGRVRCAIMVPPAVGNPVHFRWAVWLMGQASKEIRILSKRLHFSVDLLKKITAASSVFADLKPIASLRPSGCVRRLDGLPEDGIWAASVCAQPEARAKLESYISTWKGMKPVTNGDTLEQMGVPFGPRRGEILWRLRAAWLDGEVTSEAGERLLLEKLMKD
jgi:tRNA nucleotidyltransferase (CCA-adding enzyme)